MKKTELIKKTESTPEKTTGMKRRSFVKLLGGGIFIFFQPWDIFNLNDLTLPQARTLTKDYNAFLQIAEDGL